MKKLAPKVKKPVAICRVRGFTSRAGRDFIWRREAGSLKESLARGRAYRDAYSALKTMIPCGVLGSAASPGSVGLAGAQMVIGVASSKRRLPPATFIPHGIVPAGFPANPPS